jgi:hypothetical protein
MPKASSLPPRNSFIRPVELMPKAPEIAARKLPPEVTVEKPPVDSELVQDVAEKKAYLDELLATREITPELHAEEIALNERRLAPVVEAAPVVEKAPAPVVEKAPLPPVTGQPFVATVYRGDSGAATASFADPFYTTDKGVAGTYAVQKKHTMLDNEIKQIVGDSPKGDVVAAAKLHFNDRNDGKIYGGGFSLWPDGVVEVRAMVASNPALKEKGRLYAEAVEKQWKLSSLDPLKESVAESKITLKNPLVIDYEGRVFSEMLVDGEWMLPSRRGDAIGTIQEWQNSIIAKAKAEGHDGVVFANVRDSGYGLALDQAVKPGNVVVSFNNTAVKAKPASDLATDPELREAANSQRGIPESAMMRFTENSALGTPAALKYQLEHIGDLSHRLQEPRFTGSFARSKIENLMAKLFPTKGGPTLEELMDQGYENNSFYRVTQNHPELFANLKGYEQGELMRSRPDLLAEQSAISAKIKADTPGLLKEYVEAHQKENLPVTYAGKLGKEAAIALGKMDFSRLRTVMMELDAVFKKHGGTTAIYRKTIPKGSSIAEVIPSAVKPVAKGTPALEGANKLPSVANTSQDIEVRLSASTSEIPGISRLAAEVTSGDRVASQLLSSIARDSIKYLFKDIKSAKITYQPSTGRYGQSLEASLGLGITFEGKELPTVLTALSRFAKNFKQQEIHVLGEAKGSVGDTYSDGSFNTLVYTWKIPKLSPAEVADIAKNSGFKGFTLAKGKLETYFVENSQNENQIRQFRDAEENLSKLFGPASAEIRRLWAYGDGKIPLPTVPDSVPAPSKIRNATAQRIATLLASRKVKPVAQAKKLTPEQEQFQTEVAREYGKLKDDNLADPSVRRAYRELTAELIEQFDSIPAVIEFYPTGKNPYPNSAAMREDVLGNNHLYIYKTEPTSFGPPGVVYKNHPLLEPSGRVDANGEKMLNNDILRAAHDYYAHTLSPVQFGVLGEEAAARNHAAMTRSPWARWALMTETRGQNSYVNMGPNAVRNRNNPSDVIYAPQKTDLLPIRFAKAGDPVLDAEMDVIASKSSQPVAAKPRGSFPSAKDRGAINVNMLSSLGQTFVGGTAGFAYGYNKDPDASTEDKVINGVQWALFGAALGTKYLRSAALKGITNVKIPLGLLPESMRNSAFGGASNFVLFTKGILGELQTVIKSQSAETAALAYKATQSLEAMNRMRGKVSDADWNTASAYLAGESSPSLIADRKLQSQAKVIRTEIDDFGLDMIGRGYVRSGSDLEATILFNSGKYLTQTYELFTNPDFKPNPKLRDKVISEYVDQARAEGSTKPTSELETEGLAMAIDIVAKRDGSALAPKGANLAMGNGYPRTDGSMFKPRKNLSDAISKYMGRIDDPLIAASYTVDRMAHFLGASITQSKMAEVGLELKLFSRTPDSKYTVKLSSVSSQYSPKPEGSTGNYTDKNKQSKTWVVRNGEVVDTISGVPLKSSTADVGPLAPLYTTPEVSDALRTLSSYGKNGPAVRILASTTGLMKISNTAFNPESWSPNVIGSVVAVLSQGSAAKVLLHPTKTGTALKISFSDILPVKSETLNNDVRFLIREQILRHGVNAQDVVDTFKNSLFSNFGRSSNSIILTRGVRKFGSGMLNGYQKMEEIPRLIGFYAEVNKYSDALYNRLPEQLTTAERLAVYKKAATIVRENYPNYAEVPEVLRLVSLSGGLAPFISWQYEALVRNPYNTVLRAKAEMAEGFKTGNKKLTAMGVNRLSWFIGTMVGSVAIATAISKNQGLSDDQEKAARYFMPSWDKNSPLVFPEVTSDEIAYANQSYLNPQSVLGQAMDDALKGKTPVEANYNFLKSLGTNFISDGGLLINPMGEAISGTDSYGNKVYTENAGGLFDVSKLSGGTRNAAISAQQFVERYIIHGFKNIVPRAIKVANKYIKASNEEVGPNGQVYKIDDLNSRMMGLRINRMSLKTVAEYKAASLSGEMHEATISYSRARNARNVTPKSLDTAYNLYEQQRYAVWLKMQEYLRNGNVLGRSQQELLDNLSGVGTGTKIGLITDVYTPANKEKTLSARDRLEALQNLPEGQRDAEWALLLNTDPPEARKILSLIVEENREDLRGLTGPDKMLQKLDHEERAMKIAILISKIPDQTEKELEWDRLSATGLLRGRTGAILTNQDSGPLVWAEARATLERNLKRGAR